MTLIYIPRAIETVEDLENLPEGVILQARGNRLCRITRLNGGVWGVWSRDGFTDYDEAIECLTPLVALVPVEIEPSDTICRECSNRLPGGRFMPVVWHPCPTVKTMDGER